MLVINPNTPQTTVVNHPICFEGSGTISLPGDPTYVPLQIGASGSGWTYNSAAQILRRVGGDSPVYIFPDNPTVLPVQPFWIRFTNQNIVGDNYGGEIGVVDDQGRKYGIQVIRDNARGWVYNIIYRNNVIDSRSTAISRAFFVRSDGTRLAWEVWDFSHYLEGDAITLPASASWKFYTGIAFQPNQMYNLGTRSGTYQGTLPITWSSTGGTLTGTGNSRCFTADTPGNYQVCIDSDVDDPLCVDVEVDDLYLHAIDVDCDDCALVNSIIHFESNGGLDGTLDVKDFEGNTVGTVIDSLTWQAPDYPVDVRVTYTLDTDYATCVLKIIDDLEIINVDGDTLTGLVPGDKFQLLTNYPEFVPTAEEPNVRFRRSIEWTNLDCQNLVTPEGLLTIPKNYRDSCFGAVDCYIRATVKYFPRDRCPNLLNGQLYKDIRVIVNPVYPTPEFGGPNWDKWKPETPDFRVLTKTAEGGCTETHIRNKIPTMRWSVNYQGLSYQLVDPCDVTCCDDPAGFLNGFDPRYKNAKMLDDFWMLVAGQYGAFTLIDPRTGEVWRNVRFENPMARDHTKWNTLQNRDFTLIWSPCCDGGPIGGVCTHRSTVKDLIPPTVPQNLTATTVSGGIDLTWDRSVDNVGIKHYELEVNTVVRDAGRGLIYHHTDTQPYVVYLYRIRAVDFAGNVSPWSDLVSSTSTGGTEEVLEGTQTIYENTDQVLEG